MDALYQVAMTNTGNVYCSRRKYRLTVPFRLVAYLQCRRQSFCYVKFGTTSSLSGSPLLKRAGQLHTSRLMTVYHMQDGALGRNGWEGVQVKMEGRTDTLQNSQSGKRGEAFEEISHVSIAAQVTRALASRPAPDVSERDIGASGWVRARLPMDRP